LTPLGVGTFVGVLGHREFTAQPVQFSLDVLGAAEGKRVDRFGEPGTGRLGDADAFGFAPGASRPAVFLARGGGVG